MQCRTCPRCGASNPPVAKYCSSCGVPLGIPCASCGAASLPDARFCMECGTPLPQGSVMPPEPLPAVAPTPPSAAAAPPVAPESPAEIERLRSEIKVLRAECEAALAERDMARNQAQTARADLDVARAEAATARVVSHQLREEAEPILRRLVEAEEALGVRSAFRKVGPALTSDTLRKEVEATRVERQAEQQALAAARAEIDTLRARLTELEAAPANRFPPPLRRS